MMSNIATQRIKREFKEVIKSEEVPDDLHLINIPFDNNFVLLYLNTVFLFKSQ